MQRTVSYFLLAVACSCAAVAQTAPDEFERGNAFYREGKYDQAASSYEAILKQGLASSSLYFNIGNCYYRMGKIAPALLALSLIHI